MRPRVAIPLILAAQGLWGCFTPADQGVGVPHPAPGTDRDVGVAGGGGGPAARLVVRAGERLHPVSPFMLSFNRNHNHAQFARYHVDRQGMIAATQALRPRWGRAYWQSLAAEGYMVGAGPRYLYRTGHGPTDGRTDYSAMGGYFFQSLWELAGQPGTWDGYPYDDIRFTLKEAEDLGASLLVTLNFGTGTAQDAGALAAYLDGPDDELRATRPLTAPPWALADNGPRGVFMFEVGNEVQLPVVAGHGRANSIAEYVDNARPYIEAVRRSHPGPVKVALSAAVNTFWGGPTTRGDDWRQQDGMIQAFVDEAVRQGVTFEALQYHGYPQYPVREGLAGNAYAERLFRTRLMPALARSPFPIEIWNDEFHSASRQPGRNQGLYGALYAADSAVLALNLSQNGRQVMPVTTDFAWWHAGSTNNYDSLYFQNDDPAQQTPIFQFRRLLAESWDDWEVPVSLEGAGSWTDSGVNGESTVVSNLSAAAATSADGARLVLLVVNRSNTDEAARLDVGGFRPTAPAAQRTRIVPDGSVEPAWDTPWDHTRLEGDAPDWAAPIAFPKASITFLVLE